jgi:hypothetical protein
MSLSVEITRTMPLYPNGVFLQWDLRDAVESGTYLVSVYRSGSPNGPWDEIVSKQPNLFHHVDRFPTPATAGVTAPNQLSMVRGISYRILVTPPSGEAANVECVGDVEPNLEPKQRLLKRKILRDEYVMLSKLNGTEIAVMKRKRWGTRCTKCYDKYTKDSVRASCSNCYGTTFVGGYFDPVYTWAKRGTAPTQVAMAPQGKTELTGTGITMLDVPGVQEDDLIVFLRNNTRFLVKRVLPTELRLVTVHQRLEATDLARSDITYRLKVAPQFNPKLF